LSVLFDRLLRIVILGFGLLPSSSVADPWTQTPLPISNAKVTALAIAASEPSRLYLAALEDGVYRTNDRGENWQKRSKGLPAGLTIHELAVSRTDADWVIGGAAGAVYRTTDGGEHWIRSSSSFGGGDVEALLIHSDENIIQAGVVDGQEPGIYRSTDAGLSWIEVGQSLGNPVVRDFAAYPATPDLILAATSLGIAMSTNAGLDWTMEGSIPMHAISWTGTPTGLYGAGSDIYRSTDSGETFAGVNIPFYSRPCHTSAITASLLNDLELISAGAGYCAGPGPPSPPIYSWISKSTNAGTSWRTTYKSEERVGGGPYEFARDPTDGNKIYVGEDGNFGGGLRRSMDAGESWSERVSGVRNYAVRIIRGDGLGRSYAFWEEARGGLVRFEGLGLEAEDFRDVFPPNSGIGPHVIHVNLRTQGLLFDAMNYSGGDLVYDISRRSTNGGESWETIDENFYSEIATNHGTGQVVYRRQYGHFQRSDDWGDHFIPVSTLPGYGYDPAGYPVSPSWTVVDPIDPMRVFTIDRSSTYWSTDGAQTWNPRDSGLPSHGSSISPIALLMRPTDGNLLQVVYSDGRIYRSDNAGESWSYWTTLDLKGAEIVDATWDPDTRHVFVATSGSGVVSTISIGAFAIPDASPTSVFFSSATGALFVGTSNAGLFHRTIEYPRSVVLPADASQEPTSNVLFVNEVRITPNPIESSTQISFDVPFEGVNVRVEVFDPRGRRVRQLLEEEPAIAGPRDVSWDGRESNGEMLPSGIFFVRVQIGNQSTVRKTALIR